MNLEQIVPINELYPCLQSEGKLTGIPHILIRTTGCVLRCQFSETDFCDSWYTSWHPEKGQFCLQDIANMFEQYPHIKHTMITGGSPIMHPSLLKDLFTLARSYGQYITLETEGSRPFIEGCEPDLLSLSPKLSNSIPRVGTTTPNGRVVTDRDVEMHQKGRSNFKAMVEWIEASADYQLKPVITKEKDLDEVKEIQEILDIPNDMVWLMPAGSLNDDLQLKRQWLTELCWKNGYNFTDRGHIITYGNKRGV